MGEYGSETGVCVTARGAGGGEWLLSRLGTALSQRFVWATCLGVDDSGAGSKGARRDSKPQAQRSGYGSPVTHVAPLMCVPF